MDSGRVVEFGIPDTLLQNQSSYFSKLINKTSKETALALRTQARNSYLEKYKNSESQII
jgi:hypothetical protein